MRPLAVEFEITNPARFEPLRLVFNALRETKATNAFTDDHSHWLAWFDYDARSYFHWATAEENARYWQEWNATPVPQRWTDPRFNCGWHFESMIEAFSNGEYDLIACEKLDENHGRLTFQEHSFPFGGTGCMRALIECFGHRVTRDYDAED
ncbi:MAG: hypothetical protein U0792_10890 [Gemmataceae bacterium]